MSRSSNALVIETIADFSTGCVEIGTTPRKLKIRRGRLLYSAQHSDSFRCRKTYFCGQGTICAQNEMLNQKRPSASGFS